MPHYKDSNNTIHYLDSVDFEYLLPAGCVQITDEEAVILSIPKVLPLTYQELRKSEYPPMTDYLDTIVKGDLVAQQTYIDTCLAVKLKYPKL